MLTAIVSGFPDPTDAVQACDCFANSLDEEGSEALGHHLDMFSEAQVLCSWRLSHEAACLFHADVFGGSGGDSWTAA